MHFPRNCSQLPRRVHQPQELWRLTASAAECLIPLTPTLRIFPKDFSGGWELGLYTEFFLVMKYIYHSVYGEGKKKNNKDRREPLNTQHPNLSAEGKVSRHVLSTSGTPDSTSPGIDIMAPCQEQCLCQLHSWRLSGRCILFFVTSALISSESQQFPGNLWEAESTPSSESLASPTPSTSFCSLSVSELS